MRFKKVEHLQQKFFHRAVSFYLREKLIVELINKSAVRRCVTFFEIVSSYVS